MNGDAPILAGLGGVLLFLAAGRGLVELLPAFRERPFSARLGWSYLLGVAAVAGSTYALGVAFDVRLRRGVVLMPAAALVAAGLLARALRSRRTIGVPLRPPRAGLVAAQAAFGVAALIAIGLFATALTQPGVGYDGEMTWCAAARWVRADRSVFPRVLTDPRAFVSHPRYPLLMPLAQVAIQETFDASDDRRAIKPLYAAFFPALLLVFFDLARRHSGTFAAALAVTALAAVPVLAFTEFGGADGAYSDVPLGAFFGGGLLLVLGRARRSEAVAAGLLLGAAVLTKNEGLPFVLGALAAAGFAASFVRRRERRRRGPLLAIAAAGVLAAGVLLSAWRARIPQRWDENYAGRLGRVSLSREARTRLPLLPAAVMREMGDRAAVAGFPLAAAVVLVAGASGLRRRVVAPLVLSLFYCFGAYTLALLLTTWGGVEQVHPTWNRLLIQLGIPVGVLLALALRAAWRARFAAFRPATPPSANSAAPSGRSTVAIGAARGLLTFLGFAALPVVSTGFLSIYLGERARVLEGASPWREDVLLTGSMDEPAEGATVRGPLRVRGWARVPGEDLRVTVLIDGKRRAFAASARPPRRDVQSVIPSLGDCAAAGYEFTYELRGGTAGSHEIQAVFFTNDGRVRHYPARWITWIP